MKTTKGNRDWRCIPPRPQPPRPADKSGCVLYARVSTGKQEGIDSQLERLRRCAQEKGWDVLHTISADPEHGDVMERPTLDELVDFCGKHRGEVGYVLVTNFKRAARDNPRWAIMEPQLREMAIAIHSVDHDISTETPQGRHFAIQEVSAGALELEELRCKALGAKMRLRRDGCPSFRAPVGLLNARIDRRTPTLHRDPERAQAVIESFQLIDEGGSISEVIDNAVICGLRSRQGGRISRQTMASILRNPVYAGLMKPGPEGGQLIKGNWEPLVSEELFDRVQKRLDGESRAASRNRMPNAEFPLATALRCPVCGDKISGYSQKGHRYYRCRKSSSHLHIRAAVAERDLRSALSKIAPRDGYEARLDSCFEKKTSRWRERSHRLQGNERSLIRATDSVEETLATGKIDGETALRTIKNYRRRLEVSRAERDRLALIEAAAGKVRAEAKLLCSRLDKAWDTAAPDKRRGLVCTIFPGGLTYDPKTRFPRLREDLSPIFRIVSEPEVEPSGSLPIRGAASPRRSSTAASPRRTRRRRV